MRPTTIRRSLALVASAAVLASLAAATVAAPASAAKPRCAGKTATIVGTAKGEVIRGTKKADVIVAKGGNDVVYGRGGNDTVCGGGGNDRILGAGGKDVLLGQGGRDKLYGGAARDRLLGGPANDRLAGGPGNDACLQGSGTGLRLSCERPLPPVPPVVVPPPPPEAPTLVIAYSDVNTNHVYDSGDVLISKIVDTDKSGNVTVGDTVKMGQYPTSPNVIKPAQLRSQFEDWKVEEHPVVEVLSANATFVNVKTGTERWAAWQAEPDFDYFRDSDSTYTSRFFDDHGVGRLDDLITKPSPSQPTSPDLTFSTPGKGDDGFLDVEVYAP